MISFFICLALLIGGYFTYGSLVQRRVQKLLDFSYGEATKEDGH